MLCTPLSIFNVPPAPPAVLLITNDGVVVDSTINPSCIVKSSADGGGGTLRIDNGVHNNASIGFYNNQNKYWTAGMRSGNFVIASNYITTNRSGGAIQNDVAMQISQDGFVNLPNDMNLWGDIYGKRSIEATNNLTIKASTANTETKLAIFGGASIGNYWIIGQNSFGVGADNLVFGNSATAVVMQLNQNRDISIPKKNDCRSKRRDNNIAGKSEHLSQW